MPMRLARLFVIALALLAMTAGPARHANAADPSASALASPTDSPAPTLPPSVGAPGTVTAGTTIRGVIGVLIGAIIVIIGWRRRRKPNPRPNSEPSGLTRR